MTKDQEIKISKFIDDLIEYRFELIKMDHFKRRKVNYYSLEIETNIPSKALTSFGISFGTQKIYFSVGDNGDINLYRDDFMGFIDNDISFTSKYFTILKDIHTKKQNKIINDIVDSSYSDLNLRRDSNIGKLIQ